MDLHHLVSRVLDDMADEADPTVLANEVINRMDPRDYPDVIRLLIRSYVRETAGQRRRASMSVRVPQTSGSPVPASGFVTAMREGVWRERLKDRWHTADGWKLLRDMTAGDLGYAAGERRSLAAANIEEARKAEKLAALLNEHGAETVGELADDVLCKVFA